MTNDARPMSFDEFRASWDGAAEGQPQVKALQQQREFFRDPARAEALLRPGAINLADWPLWDGNVAKVPA
jgi:hypothetical protein